MLQEEFALTEEQKKTLLSMNEYWREISGRADWHRLAPSELDNLIHTITPMQVLLIVGEHAQTNARRAVIKPGWEGAGKEFTILGPSVELRGQQWTPCIFDNEEDPEWMKTVSFKLL